jgi:hypothetical protein
MTYSSHPDRISDFREVTAKSKGAVSMTFRCSICKQHRPILGRKSVKSAGSKRLWACAICLAPDGA